MSPHALAWTAGSLGALAVGTFAWGLAEARAYTVRERTVPVLEPGSEPIRVLHVSDFHVTPTQAGKLAWIRSLARWEPDLVVATGDFLSHAEAVDPLLEAMAPLLKLPGVFVRGSNDYFAPRPLNPFTYFGGPSRLREERTALPTDALTAGLGAHGWLDLDNARGVLTVAGREVTFVGLDDPHIGRDRMPAPDPHRGQLHVGVTHAPYARALGALKDDGAQVLLAGHTHGGQVCVPWYGALVTNCDLDTGRVKGVSGWPGARPDARGGVGAGGAGAGAAGAGAGGESVWLHVCAGAGTSPYVPLRFACRPEAVLLTLTPRA